MIDLSSLTAVPLTKEGGVQLFSPPSGETPAKLRELSAVKKLKFEIEAFLPSGQPPVMQAFFFKEKLRSIFPNRRDHNLPSGVIEALQFAREKEDSWFRISPRSQDFSGIANYPVEAEDLVFRIKILQIDWSQSTQPSDPFSFVRAALVSKERGNLSFQAGDFSQAAKEYSKGVGFLLNIPKKTKEAVCASERARQFEAESQKLLVDLLNNCAIAQINSGNFSEARASACEVLKVQPENEKALYRLARICEAEEDFERAVEIYAKLGMKAKADFLAHRQKKRQRAMTQKLRRAF